MHAPLSATAAAPHVNCRPPSTRVQPNATQAWQHTDSQQLQTAAAVVQQQLGVPLMPAQLLGSAVQLGGQQKAGRRRQRSAGAGAEEEAAEEEAAEEEAAEEGGQEQEQPPARRRKASGGGVSGTVRSGALRATQLRGG